MLHVTDVCVLFLSVQGLIASSGGEVNADPGGEILGNSGGNGGVEVSREKGDKGEGEGESWSVSTSGGMVRGRRTSSGYYTFFGIPYGAPPTGEHRFKAPRPAKPWSDILEADSPRFCAQPSNPYSVKSVEEDCLTVDVYTPSPIPSRTPRAVYFHIHGGSYLFDQGPLSSYSVRYILKHDVIVVSVKYRLGVLGWLCLGTEDVPGNAGFRDILLALRWVQDNIAAFGGDPTRVALVGHSSGAYAAHTLALSPAAAGLYHAVVGADGTALISKHLMTYPVTVAQTYAKKLGFDTNDVAELTKFYKEASVEKLLNQSLEFANSFDNGDIGFGVCVERPIDGVQPVVLQPPRSALAVNRKPVLFTFSNDEGSLKAPDLIKKNRKYNENFSAFMPSNLDFPSNESKYAASNETRLLYFGNETITTESRPAFTKFWGDKDYEYQAVYSAREHVKFGVPVHLLEFTCQTGLSDKKPEPTGPGAGHPDFFRCLMPTIEVQNAIDIRIVEEITSIVAHFIKTGQAQASAPWPSVEPWMTQMSWLRVSCAGAEPHVATPSPELNNWHRLYQRYRRTNYRALSEGDKY